MNGFDIARARKAAGINQRELADALCLKGGRGTLTDIENGLVEVTDGYVLRVIGTINGLHTNSAQTAA